MTTELPLPLLGLGALAALIVAGLTLRASDRLAVGVWVVALCFVPVWVGLNISIFGSVIVALTLLALCARGDSLRLHWIDAVSLLFLALAILLLAVGEVRLSPVVTALESWLFPYFWGRIVAVRVSRDYLTKLVAASAAVVAGLGVIEFVTSTNLFVLIPGSGTPYTTWSALQYRGGVLRVEGAFGHSIALGGFLAMSSAFVMATRWRLWIKVCLATLMGVAAVLTLSRIGAITFALTVALSVLTLREVTGRTRITFTAVLAVGVGIALPMFQQALLAAGSEADGSAQYRTDILILLGQVRLVGGNWSWESLVVGDTYLGVFARSTDNAFLSILLRFGYVPTALLLLVLTYGVILMVINRRPNPAGIAVLCQLPALFAVAMITQYGTFLWFLAGVAVVWSARGADPGALDGYSGAKISAGEARRPAIDVGSQRAARNPPGSPRSGARRTPRRARAVP